MRGRLFTLLLFISCPAWLWAQQFPSELWHEGMVVLANQDTLVGKIKYDLTKNLIQVNVNDKIRAYGAKSIFYFRIYDEKSETSRQFYVLPYGLVTSYKVPTIFEVLVEGNITLLAREYIDVRSVPNPYGMGSYPQETLVYDFFFLDRQGKITKYHMKRKELLEVLRDKEKEVAEYMRQHNLRHNNRNDLVRIIAFYNAII